MGGEAKSKSSPIRKEVPKEETQVSSLNDEAPRSAPPKQIPPKDSKPSFGESAKQFASGFAKGVSAESLQLYNDTKELPSQLAKAGTELAEDLKSGRELRALAPLRAASHAIRNASRKDVERIAHAVVDTAKEWLDKPAYEKGESLGRATTAIASEVAIDVLTEGIGSVATLRKVGKVADAADHVRDAEKAVEKTAERLPPLRGHDGLGGKRPIAPGKPGSYTPDRTLPTDKQGIPLPDSPDPHTQLGRSKPKYGAEPQAREWGHGSNANLQPTRDIDFTDHGSPSIHPSPHQHSLTPNNPTLAPQGGFRRGPPEPL
jgi:hypothetical protein